MKAGTSTTRFAWVLLCSLLLASSPLMGQILAPQRLSDWLLEQAPSAHSYPLGLSWRVPEETVPQSALFLELLQNLSGTDRGVTADLQALGTLRDWVRALPVTGRVNVAVADARWLQANPARDPILLPGHSVTLPARPRSVTVITARGERCAVAHAPGLEARAYLETCMPASVTRTDWAWVAQPDGRVQRLGVALWNRHEQDQPAPGAWIWAPPRDDGWSEEVSHRLISFLATQGPAPDPSPGTTPSNNAGAQQLRTPTAPATRSRNPEVSASDWGGVGLLQTPTARMAKTGYFSFHYSRARPYTRGNTFLQPFDWLEAGFRYSDVSNRPYGPEELSGDQTFKDKSIDAKFRLWSESAYIPEIAVGLRDVAGTGLFSGEYVVASKRTGNFDWSLGMGWGYLGGRGNLDNPLSSINRLFDTRKSDVGLGGNFGFGSYFRGPTSVFGGVQYQTPWERLSLKLEYDGNNYQKEPLSNNLKQSSPLNLGLVYRAARWMDLSLGIERGNTVMFGVTLHTQLDGMETPKVNDPPRIPVAVTRPQQAPDWAATSREITRQTGWHVGRIEQHGRELRVVVDDAQAIYLRDRVDKVTAVLHRDAPGSVDRFLLTYRQRGLDMTEHVVDRATWVAQQVQPLPPHQRRETVMQRPVETPSKAPAPRAVYEHEQPRFEHGLGFDYQQTIGGPDGFVLYQISAVERARLRIRDDTWLQGSLRLGLLNNYEKFRFTAPSELPRVRTFLREYLTTSSLTIPNLQMTHVGKLGENQFYSVYGGYLEPMFAGAGAEWLYKRSGARTAVGVDLNAVRQRAFEQDFSLRDYSVVTGHATLYWDTGWRDVQAKISVGRYLAKDVGATLELARVFRNGVVIGALATKTNVSAAQFGEGSFDKGIYLSIPFDAMLTRSTNTVGHFVWKPLTRDGGAMLARGNMLHGLTITRNERALWYEPAPRPNEAVIPADRREAWTPPPTGPVPYLQVVPKPAAAQWTPDSNQAHRLVEALYRQGFRNIRAEYDLSHRLTLTLSHDTLRPISRAVGRAARTAVRLAPLETREIRIAFAWDTAPVATYDFVDLERLNRYFGGAIVASELEETVAVAYADRSAREQDPLAMLDDVGSVEVTPRLSEILPGYRAAGRVREDLAAASRTAAGADWLQAGVLGAGVVLASSALDERAFRFAKDHADHRLLKGFNRVGQALPWLGAGLVTWAALDGSDPRRQRTGFAALEAGGVAFAASTGLKYLAGRARPEAELGTRNFKPFSSQDSFPSRTAMLAWAVATPFALEYDSNWRYAAAAITALSRVSSREHWVSDTVAGSLLGYGIGRIFWESSRSLQKGEPRVLLDPTGINVAWELD